jgi:hypothetical protein
MIDYQFLLICAVVDTIVIFPLGFIAGYMPIMDDDNFEALITGIFMGLFFWALVLAGCYWV